MVTVTKREESLLHIYSGQEPQPCYVELDLRSEELVADWNAESGNAVPSAVWHGAVRRYAIPCLRTRAVNDLLDAIAPAAQRVVAGWDGIHLDNDASLAEMEIEREIERWADAEIEREIERWADAGDWLYDCRQELASRIASGETVEDLAAELDGDGSEDSPVLIGLMGYLENLEITT